MATITSPYSTVNFNYTLKDDFITISTATADTYFTLDLTIKYYEFYSHTLITTVKNSKLPLFNLATKVNIGRVIHRIMANIKAPAATDLQYDTCVVDLVFKELNISDDTTVATTNFTGYNFIAGVEPPLLNSNKAILTTNTNASRVTPTGVFNVNFLIPAGSYSNKIYKNGVGVSSSGFIANSANNVFTDIIDVATLGGIPGDVFKYELGGITTLYKEVVVVEEGTEDYTILFPNEFKVLESLQCTGAFNFNTKYKRITHNYKKDLVDILEIIKTTKINYFKINTGWLLETDNLTLDTLLMAKKGWLKTPTGNIEVIPIDKKLVNKDSKNNLYQYDIQFQINRATDAQNYSF